MIEIKAKWEQDVWFFVGPKKNPAIAQGKVQGIFVNHSYQIVYLVMDVHVVYTKNDKYKQGEYLRSKDITDDDIGKIAFLNKDEIKNKLREIRRANNG